MFNIIDFAKVMTGFAINEIISHAILGVSGITVKVLGIKVTPSFDRLAVLIWVGVLVLSVYYGWF